MIASGSCGPKRDNASRLLVLVGPMIDIVGADDVILAEVGSDLDLDQFKRHSSWVLQAVPLGRRDVNALVFTQVFFCAIYRHARRAMDDHPVLGSVMVHLHGQDAAWFDVQELHLEARSDRERFEKSPRAVDFHVLLRFGSLMRLETLDAARDIL